MCVQGFFRIELGINLLVGCSMQFLFHWQASHPSFPLTTTMVKSNVQNKSSATNACPPGPQATSTSISESPDSLNLISCASSRAGKHIHPRGCSCARCTVRRSSRSVSATEVSRNASPELFSFSEKEESEKEEVSLGPRTPTASRIIIGKLSHRIALLQLPAAPEGRTHSMSWDDQVSAEESKGLASEVCIS